MPLAEEPDGDQASMPENRPPGEEVDGRPPRTVAGYASFTATTAPTPAASFPLTASTPS
ncbi:hypothetical protein [Actinomadura sp. NPDC000600]|uniref:hypothetical protein n=1 Tax=Actinomadura sp. NPDC000600 TaxID=3154262 RepID=UPI0033975464